jgi:hypothetical protein
MSIATVSDEEIGEDPPPEWISLAECCRILGRRSNPSAVKSIALAGAIRTQALPGTRILYSRADALRLAAR